VEPFLYVTEKIRLRRRTAEGEEQDDAKEKKKGNSGALFVYFTMLSALDD
jgi:hypothetical protein